MRRRRRRNLSRNKKIGLALVSVAAVGGATALFVTMRRKKAPELGDGGDGGTQGGTGTVNLVNRAKRRLCINPNALTYDQRQLLRDAVFIPLINALPNPAAIGSAEIAADQALKDLCPPPRRPGVVEAVNQLAQQAWEVVIGFSG